MRGQRSQRQTSRSFEYFPLLEGTGLQIVNMLGDGNCLFRAFSDQLFGHPDLHLDIRRNTVNYMRSNKDDFIQFFSTDDDTRRSTRLRRTTRAKSDETPSQAAVDFAFEKRMSEMETDGTWADHLEICAFSRAYNVRVRVWRTQNVVAIPEDNPDGPRLPEVRIVYHDWEHYSSLQAIDKPHQGVFSNPLHTLADACEMMSRKPASDLEDPAEQMPIRGRKRSSSEASFPELPFDLEDRPKSRRRLLPRSKIGQRALSTETAPGKAGAPADKVRSPSSETSFPGDPSDLEDKPKSRRRLLPRSKIGQRALSTETATGKEEALVDKAPSASSSDTESPTSDGSISPELSASTSREGSVDTEATSIMSLETEVRPVPKIILKLKMPKIA